MWMKVAGAALVMFSCTVLGAATAGEYKRRREVLETLKRMISQLKGEILYSSLPLEQAFLRTGNRGSGPAAEFFISVAEELDMDQGKSFEEIWKEKAEQFSKRVPLGETESGHLKAFGACLGYLDRDMQERTMNFYMEELEQEIKDLRSHETERCRLAIGLGILSGLFFCVVLL